MTRKEPFLKVILCESKRMISASKLLFAVSVLICIVDSLLALGYTVMLNRLVEALADSGMLAKNSAICIALFCGFALILILRELSNGVLNYVLDKQIICTEGKLKLELIARMQAMPVLEFEKPETLDALNKAKSGLSDTAAAFMFLELGVASSLFYLILITAYMVSIHPLLCVVILAAFLPTLLSYALKSKYVGISEALGAVERRHMDAAEKSICDRAFFKETRHLGASGYFLGNFRNAANAFVRIKSKAFHKVNALNFVVDLTQFFGFIATLAVMYYLIYCGKITVGAVAAVVATIELVHSRLQEFFGTQIANIAEAYPGMCTYHAIMQTDGEKTQREAVEEAMPDAVRSLKLEHVYFRYPNAEKDALSDINFTINAGETVCIVGENGSGKSTLSKILLGLYPASCGSVVINENMAIGAENLHWLREHSSSVFQEFRKYKISLKDNVLVGDVHNATNERLLAKVQEARLTALMDSLADGMDTMLSKEFGGVDLSGGQWQRIAIARGMLKSTDCIVFDEPTAAIDPIFELELLGTMLGDADHSIRIIITHRIGVATKADRILVMKHGRLVENGKHSELMRLNGEYARLFGAQSQWYQ